MATDPNVFSTMVVKLNHTINRAVVMLVTAKGAPVVSNGVLRKVEALTTGVTVRVPRSRVNDARFEVLFLTTFLLFMFAFFIGSLTR